MYRHAFEQALASGTAGRSLPTAVTNVLAVGPLRAIESIDQSTVSRCNGFDLLTRHQADRL